MTLYVEQLLDPLPGQDWQYTIPGRYLEDITTVTATLTTGHLANVLPDASGNGRNGLYFPLSGAGFPTLVAGLVAGDQARQWADAALANTGGAIVNGSGFDFTAPYSLEWWFASVGAPLPDGFVLGFDDGGAQYATVSVGNTGILQYFRSAGIPNETHQTAAGAVPLDGLAHHIVITFDGITTLLYVDGALVPWAIDTPAVALGPASWAVTLGFAPILGLRLHAITDELAIYAGALTAGQVAAHYAAGGAGFATYVLAIHADTPAMYYHLDDSNGTGRTPGFTVTDGTSLVADIGTGFTAPALGPTFAYSWIVHAGDNVQTNSGRHTTVALPELILPAGYTIGTLTPDIQPGDQWSNVVVWWDDTYQEMTINLDKYHYPPGAFYVYQQTVSP